jgi:hypothetical protein
MKVVIEVVHHHQAKMVGKVFPVGSRGEPTLIFFHSETHPSQAHRNLNSPGGVDVCVLDYLATIGVEWVHHHRPSDSATLVAPLWAFDHYAIPQRSGGRERRYLAYDYWDIFPVTHPAVAYEVPWIEDEIVLDPGLDQRPAPRMKVARGTGVVSHTLPLPGF